jgi:formate hydrogenlyase transcriptional activator
MPIETLRHVSRRREWKGGIVAAFTRTGGGQMTAKIITLNPVLTGPDSFGYGLAATRALEVVQPIRTARSNSYFYFEEHSDRRRDRDGCNDFEGIVGSCQALHQVLDLVRMVAPTSSTVLIEGETGTGKELVARAIHMRSQRQGRPFVKLNCAAIPASLLESELFGHEKGAFTGAVMQKPGRFEAANGGTLFLDEIGDMPLELQAKVLRVLQEREFERLGSTITRHLDVRVVAATNQDLSALVAVRQFRMDLYYRLDVFPVAIPPLRHRVEDIPLLVTRFVRHFCERMSKQISRVLRAEMDALMRYPWPGNIRELQNYIERAVIMSQGDVLEIAALPAHQPVPREPVTLAEAERYHILKALEESHGVVGGVSGAAARLGVKRTTLIDKMRRRGISSEMPLARDQIDGHRRGEPA